LQLITIIYYRSHYGRYHECLKWCPLATLEWCSKLWHQLRFSCAGHRCEWRL
jgi:hypothetical protein